MKRTADAHWKLALWCGQNGLEPEALAYHQFRKAGRGWTLARDLKPDNPIRTLGGLAWVEGVETDQVQPVFNLQVAEGEGFLAGKQGGPWGTTTASSRPSPLRSTPSRAWPPPAWESADHRPHSNQYHMEHGQQQRQDQRDG